MVNIKVRAKNYLATVPSHIKTSVYPLTEIDTKMLESFQVDLQVFKGVKMQDIAFMTKKFDTINLFRGCILGCQHCSKNSMSPAFGRESILYEDLKWLVLGFRALSERLGFNVLNGNKSLNIVEDSNPFNTPIRGLKREHTVLEAMNLIYSCLGIPISVKTSILNGIGSINFNKTRSVVKHFVNRAKRVPDEFSDIQISFNPFLRDEPMYIQKMAKTLSTFLDLFKIEKAKINYQYAQDGYEGYDKRSAQKLYQMVYKELQKISDSNLEGIPQLHPDIVTRPSPLNVIQPLGRGKNFFNKIGNEKISEELARDKADFEALSKDEQYRILLDEAEKRVDIDGTVYATRLFRSKYLNFQIELPQNTEIKLNFRDKRKPNKIFCESDNFNPLK